MSSFRWATDLNLVTASQSDLEPTGLHENLRSINIEFWALYGGVSGVEVMHQSFLLKTTRWQEALQLYE